MEDKLNKTLLALYFIVAIIVFSAFIAELVELYNANHTVEIIVFNILLPLWVILGVIAYPSSYKLILVKLSIPVLLFLIFLFVDLFIWTGEARFWVSSIMFASIIGFSIFLLTTTFISNLFIKFFIKRNKSL